MTPLLATGTVAGRRYALAVGLYALAVYLPAHGRRCERLEVVHQPLRSIAEGRDAVAVVRALGLPQGEKQNAPDLG